MKFTITKNSDGQIWVRHTGLNIHFWCTEEDLRELEQAIHIYKGYEIIEDSPNKPALKQE